jgi:hypothetical protein
LNNVVEQDHRRIKQRIRPMLGFKRFETAAVTIRGQKRSDRSSALGGDLGGIEPRKSFCQNEHPFIGNCTRTVARGFNPKLVSSAYSLK